MGNLPFPYDWVPPAEEIIEPIENLTIWNFVFAVIFSIGILAIIKIRMKQAQKHNKKDKEIKE